MVIARNNAGALDDGLGPPTPPGRSVGSKALEVLRANSVWVLTVLLVLGFATQSPFFLSFYNLSNIFLQAALIGFLAIGLTPIVISGNIDLTVGAVVGLAACLAIGLQDPLGLWGAIFIAILAGLGLGIANGLIVELTGVNSFIVTLAGMIGIRGLTFVITGDTSLSPNDMRFAEIGMMQIGGVSVIAVVFLLLVFAIRWMLRSTVHGRNTYAIGGNRQAAIDAGIPIMRHIVANFAISGLMAAIAGVFMAARLNAATPSFGKDYELWAVIAVVLGGTSLRGGRGSVIGTLAAVLALAILQNGLNLIHVSPFYVSAIMGAALILTLLIDRQFNRSGKGAAE